MYGSDCSQQYVGHWLRVALIQCGPQSSYTNCHDHTWDYVLSQSLSELTAVRSQPLRAAVNNCCQKTAPSTFSHCDPHWPSAVRSQLCWYVSSCSRSSCSQYPLRSALNECGPQSDVFHTVVIVILRTLCIWVPLKHLSISLNNYVPHNYK